ncbi:gpt [Symbiodinium pilosum]|uniref:Gpt protein n=1 Tax=Symbiodinium pilosum TaxID=2952 RepID=A0A812RXH7_SYMPI|nr:gpt [Symbiodinium pilosum]
MSLSDLEANIQRTAESEAKVLPSAERVARLEKQPSRLGGLIFNEDTEPSHKLVDKACQQFENGIIEYIHPGKCASRKMEADSHKLEQTFVIDPSTGNLKGSKKETETMCPINDGLRLPDALQRRADKFLFGRIAEDTRAKLEQNLPMPDSNTGWSIQRQKKKAKKDKKNADANKDTQADKGREDKPKFQLPEGCVAKMPDGKPLCFLFSRGVCKRCPPGKRLPHLAPKDSSRVRSANELCGFVVSVLYAIFPAGQPVVISIENPLNSWLWPYLDSLVKAMGDDAFMQWCVIFDHCMLGGTRDKAARWRGVLTWATKLEAEYPTLLCRTAAACLQHHWKWQPPVSTPERAALALSGKQKASCPPLLPEYSYTCRLQQVPPGRDYKVLRSLAGSEGEVFEGTQDDIHLDSVVGVYATPHEFLYQAQFVPHPLDQESDTVHDVLKRTIHWRLTTSEEEVVKWRDNFLSSFRRHAQENEEAEKELHGNLHPEVEEVVKGKNILTWKWALSQLGYDDEQATAFMTDGVPMVGNHDAPPIYPEILKPAKEVVETLEATAGWRRFLIWQNEKARVIDDPKESQINDCFAVRSKLALQDTDFWIKILGKVSRSLESGTSRHVLSDGEVLEGAIHPDSLASPFLGRGVDLSKAYKQVPVSPGSKKLMVLAVWNDKRSDYSFFLVNSTPFGGSASVYGFNRISRTLWWLMVLGLGLIATTYFDDFLIFENQRLADMTELYLSNLLDLLNWKHATTGPKPFDQTFSILR